MPAAGALSSADSTGVRIFLENGMVQTLCAGSAEYMSQMNAGAPSKRVRGPREFQSMFAAPAGLPVTSPVPSSILTLGSAGSTLMRLCVEG